MVFEVREVDQVHEEDYLFAPQEEEQEDRQEKIVEGFPSWFGFVFLFPLNYSVRDVEEEHQSDGDGDVLE